MRLLLDTQIFLWSLENSPKLSSTTRTLIEDAQQVFVSAVSIWEIAIKAGLGKLEADAEKMRRAIRPSGFIELPIALEHAAGVQQLPNLHGDPFDRLLVVQAMMEPLRLLTTDGKIAQYSDLVILTEPAPGNNLQKPGHRA